MAKPKAKRSRSAIGKANVHDGRAAELEVMHYLRDHLPVVIEDTRSEQAAIGGTEDCRLYLRRTDGSLVKIPLTVQVTREKAAAALPRKLKEAAQAAKQSGIFPVAMQRRAYEGFVVAMYLPDWVVFLQYALERLVEEYNKEIK